jgi:hypothetical protein
MDHIVILTAVDKSSFNNKKWQQTLELASPYISSSRKAIFAHSLLSLQNVCMMPHRRNLQCTVLLESIFAFAFGRWT